MTKQQAMEVVRYYLEANDFDREKAIIALTERVEDDLELAMVFSEYGKDLFLAVIDKYNEVLH